MHSLQQSPPKLFEMAKYFAYYKMAFVFGNTSFSQLPSLSVELLFISKELHGAFYLPEAFSESSFLIPQDQSGAPPQAAPQLYSLHGIY